MELTERIQTSELAQIVESVFGTMMSLEVVFAESPYVAGAERLIAAVHLTGEWNGSVLLECDGDVACRFTGRFLSMDPLKR